LEVALHYADAITLMLNIELSLTVMQQPQNK